MKKILVIYYTQTGQLSKAVNAVLEPFINQENIHLTFAEIKPLVPYPHPWKYMEFCEVFPETVQGKPCEIELLAIDENEDFDLVIIAYQSWFLTLSIPVNSFLMTEQAKKIFKNKPVVSIVACRNMWYNAQEKMKFHLKNLNAKLVGHISFVDKAPNIVTLITVIAFSLKGEKGKYLGVFPKYGVSDEDLKAAPKFGNLILNHLQKKNYDTLQEELILNDAINIKRNLILLEGRGKAMFPVYANFISAKGGAGDKNRRGRVRSFAILLPTVLFILSPIITIISRFVPLIKGKKFKEEIYYYSRNSLR